MITVTPKIKVVVQNVNMALSHDGLARVLLSETRIDVRKLNQGELVLCLNRRGDKLKILGGFGDVIGYIRAEKGRRLMKEALQFLPQTFGGSGFSYSKACEKVLAKRLLSRAVNQ